MVIGTPRKRIEAQSEPQRLDGGEERKRSTVQNKYNEAGEGVGISRQWGAMSGDDQEYIARHRPYALALGLPESHVDVAILYCRRVLWHIIAAADGEDPVQHCLERQKISYGTQREHGKLALDFPTLNPLDGKE